MTAYPMEVSPVGVRVFIKLTPKSSRAKLESIETEADGSLYLKARVTEVPEKGKANKGLLKLLSKQWGIPASQIELVSGDTNRRKVVRVPADYAGALGDWFAAL